MNWMADADEIQRLRRALEKIDAIAVMKKAGAAKRMQEIAREALERIIELRQC